MSLNGRYRFPKKSIKTDCPECGHKYRKTLSRYVDTQTGQPLPTLYGRCDRSDKCGYHLSPYEKSASGLSYANDIYQSWKFNNPGSSRSSQSISQSRTRTISEPIYTIPNDVFLKSLSHYDRNNFAQLMKTCFGPDITDTLIARFQIGTMHHWSGGCVFWLIDEKLRVRSGQAVLFDSEGKTVKHIRSDGTRNRYARNIHVVMQQAYRKSNRIVPYWLTDFSTNAPKWPTPFGLHQLVDAPLDQPIAIVESAKTAVLCSAYFPEFTWLAIGSLSYLTVDRLFALKNRSITLYPDLSEPPTGKLSAYEQWNYKAAQLQRMGFRVTVSDLLERSPATGEQRRNGYDLADYLLRFSLPAIPHK